MKAIPFRFIYSLVIWKVVIVGVSFAAQTSSNMVSLPATEILAKGKGILVTRAQFQEAVNTCSKETMDEMAGNMPVSKIEQLLLDGCITKALVLARIKEADSIKARALFQEGLRDHKSRLKMNDAQYEQYLAKELPKLGFTRERWETWNLEKFLMPLVMERELFSEITEKQINDYYEQHATTYILPDKVRCRYICLRTMDPNSGSSLSEAEKKGQQKKIKEILQRARKGEDFQELFKKYSEVTDNNGEYIFSRGFLPSTEFEAVFSLKENEISDVIFCDAGLFIVQLCEHIPSRKMQLGEARTDIVKRLIAAHTRDYLHRIRQEAGVVVYGENAKGVISEVGRINSSKP
jgi:PPIC-type PPIASE domain